MSTLSDLKVLWENRDAIWGQVKEDADLLLNQASFGLEAAEAKIQNAKSSVFSTIESGISTIESGISKAVGKAIPTAIAAAATPQIQGSQGTYLDFIRPVYLASYFMNIESDRHVYIGHVLHEVRTLSALSGFTVCNNVQLDIAGATVEEIDIIKTILETGVILE